MPELYHVVFVSLMFLTRWTHLTACQSTPYWSADTQILPRFCQNPTKYRIKNFKKMWFFLMNAKISWFLKMIAYQTGWIWFSWTSSSDFQQIDWHHGTHLISLVTDQTKIRRPPMNSLPIALRLYAIASVVLLLVKLQLHKAAYSYCIVTIYLACVHWHSYCYMILTLEMINF